MNQILTQHFLSLEKQDGKEKKLLNASYSEENVISFLDSIFSEWSMEITSVTDVGGTPVVAVTLYLPGRILAGTGNTEVTALNNIVKRMKSSETSLNSQKTSSDPVAPVSEKDEIQAKNDEFFACMNLDADPEKPQEVQKQEELPEELDFDSIESRKAEQEFQDYGTIGINEVTVLKPTAKEVNPNNEVLIRSWTVEQGQKLKEWSAKHGITQKEQMSSWLNSYCGLDYDHFNPAWVDKFIEWAESLREKQTY